MRVYKGVVYEYLLFVRVRVFMFYLSIYLMLLRVTNTTICFSCQRI